MFTSYQKVRSRYDQIWCKQAPKKIKECTKYFLIDMFISYQKFVQGMTKYGVNNPRKKIKECM